MTEWLPTIGSRLLALERSTSAVPRTPVLPRAWEELLADPADVIAAAWSHAMEAAPHESEEARERFEEEYGPGDRIVQHRPGSRPGNARSRRVRNVVPPAAAEPPHAEAANSPSLPFPARTWSAILQSPRTSAASLVAPRLPGVRRPLVTPAAEIHETTSGFVEQHAANTTRRVYQPEPIREAPVWQPPPEPVESASAGLSPALPEAAEVSALQPVRITRSAGRLQSILDSNIDFPTPLTTSPETPTRGHALQTPTTTTEPRPVVSGPSHAPASLDFEQICDRLEERLKRDFLRFYGVTGAGNGG